VGTSRLNPMLLAAHGAIKPLGPGNDPFWANVVYMQTFDGIAAGTVLADPIPSLKAGGSYTSVLASKLTVSSAQSRFGNSAAQNATGFCRISTSISGAFTFECSTYYVGGYTVLLLLQSDVNNIATFSISTASSILEVAAAEGGGYVNLGSVAANAWYDCAVSWDGSALRCFVNGALVLTTTKTNPATTWRLGYGDSTPNFVYLDDVRITSACRYTASYTPSHPFIAA
jgi:hypothetical protein